MLLKYNSSGSLLWTQETGSSGEDQGMGVAVTADGSSIYVMGLSSGSVNGQPYAGGRVHSLEFTYIYQYTIQGAMILFC